ncbi:MAG TPA: NIPSNAP family protein [Verrucomicrobiae bacterium]
MNRRRFITTTAAAAAITGLTSNLSTAMAADSAKTAKPEYYEWRTYWLKTPEQLALVERHWAKAAIPALNRLGIPAVGAFREQTATTPLKFCVLIPYVSLEQFQTVNDKLAGDAQYQKNGAEYLGVEAKAPAYERIESTLMLAFDGMTKLEVPKLKGQPRMFVLRTYESHNEPAGKKKIEMFNKGEIGIFRRTGLTPVFFGETVLGANRPNLTYLLVFKDMADHDASWNKFRTDAEWVKLKAIPEYADAKIVSKIVKTFLVPAEGSQI